MITTLKQAEEYMKKCYDKFFDLTMPKEDKIWYSVAKNILVEKIEKGELK